MIEIHFQNKPISASIKHNAFYKLIILMAILNYCARGKKASLLLIHLVFWALRNSDNYKILYDFSKNCRETLIPWAFETGIDQVLSLGYIYGFLEKEIVTDTLEIKLNAEGQSLLTNIMKEKLFEEDINRIKEIGQLQKGKTNKANSNWTLI
ncbi:hypothetical protein [Chryseobacterium indologenes]|uniref:hypothetical protein n=1 Tax=Chryseobacterium indologenes TaxID=253 RepID=UPI000647F6EB|nr:hypothetical protein [Chryseobacterium indologenes]